MFFISLILILIVVVAIVIGAYYLVINHKVIFDYLFKSSYMPV